MTQQPHLGKYAIAAMLAEKHHLSRNRAVEIVGDVVEAMFQSLSAGVPVTFQNFGSLKPYENYGEVVWKPNPEGTGKRGGGQLGRAHEDDPVMDVIFRISPVLLDALNNAEARQTSRRYSRENKVPRKLMRRPPSRTKKKGRKANG